MRRHTQQLQPAHHHNTLRQPDWQEVVGHLEERVFAGQTCEDDEHF